MDDKVKDLVGTAMSRIKELSDADTIIGDTIKIDGNISIIPVSKVSYGFAAGGSDLPSKTNSSLFGGGTGGGVTIQPLAFIVVSGGDVKLLQLNQDKSSTGAIVNLVPELFDKIQGLFTKDKSKNGSSEQSAQPNIDTEGLNLSLDDDDDSSGSEGGKSNFAGEFDF